MSDKWRLVAREALRGPGLVVVVISTATTLGSTVTATLGIAAWPPVIFAAGGLLLLAAYVVLASRIVSNAEIHREELTKLQSQLHELQASHEDEALRARWDREFGDKLTAHTGTELLSRAAAELSRLDASAMAGGARERRRFDEFASRFLALYAKYYGTSGKHFGDQHERIENMSRRHREASVTGLKSDLEG